MIDVGTEGGEGVGPDLCGLMVGSEGLLGIAIEITVRLMPSQRAITRCWPAINRLPRLAKRWRKIIASGLLPAALEIMDVLSMQAASAAVGAKYPPNVDAVLIVELDGTAEAVAAEKIKLAELIDSSGATEVWVAKDADERATIWKGRKSVFSAVGRLSPDFIVQDGVVPRGKLGFALERIGQLSREADIAVANVFHGGRWQSAPTNHVRTDAQPGALHRAEELAAKIVSLCVELGGSITGEHGVGMEKRQFFKRHVQRRVHRCHEGSALSL